MPRSPRLAPFALGALLASGVAATAAHAQPPTRLTLDRLIAAEDARGATPDALATLQAGARAPDPALRRHAVRGLGRQERADLLDAILAALDDADAEVRRRAALAAAQAVTRPAAPREAVVRARDALGARLVAERDAGARDGALESLGRLRADTLDVASVAGALAAALPARGAARGLFFLTRQTGARGRLPAAARAALRTTATTASLTDDVRGTAAAAWLAGGGLTAADSAALRADASPAVRALVATPAMLDDPAPVVRARALARAECMSLGTAVRDPDVHVALAAADALARCAGDAGAAAALEALVASAPAGSASDGARGAAAARAAHLASHALASLAAVDAARARAPLAAALASPDPWRRLYAVRAAARLRDTTALRTLARDRDANVAADALEALRTLRDPGVRALALDALRSTDAQVLLAAAPALAGDATARPALEAALARMTARRRETERDARLALVEALGAAVPAAYARDWDPVLAARAAALTGATAAPRPLPEARTPTVAQLAGVRGATITMADGAVIELRLHPLDAPTNAWRFARLARAGWFDGLTFHRVAPFFVVQGGSPRANEYVGDGPFTRDEVGLENRRGTVGVSTRGRDTGDGQLYVNTVDNARLDHDYTVFAEVVRGMDVVDRLLEGARIRRVVVR